MSPFSFFLEHAAEAKPLQDEYQGMKTAGGLAPGYWGTSYRCCSPA
jgi:hypothetical protein